MNEHYMNEFDPFAAEWLRGLMRGGEIPHGTVDERSIKDVKAADLVGYNQCHFFAGIGGWPLAFRLAGISPECRGFSGSCPCQPFSDAGKGLGTADPRHLWPDFCGLIAQCEPPIVVGEQVASKDGRHWVAGVRADLEALGYAGVFPLAHGIPRSMGQGQPELRKLARSASQNRVGRLKGYGNAIVPQVAAVFLQAFMESF